MDPSTSLLTLSSRGSTFVQHVNPNTTLDDLLLFFEVHDQQAFQTATLQRQDYERTQFLAYTGKPDQEDYGPDGSAVISIQYNVPGLMQPHLTFDNGQTYQANTCDFGAITLGQVYLQDGEKSGGKDGDDVKINTFPVTISVTLKHVYTTDHISKQQQQDAIAQVMKSFNDPARIAAPSGQNGPKITQTQTDPEQLRDLNEMLGELESRYTFAKPKVIVSVRLQAPPAKPKPQSEQLDQNVQKNQNEKTDQGDSTDSSIPSDEECSDSDDDRFYKHTKQDYRVIHRQYLKNRQELKKEMEKEKLLGKTPICTVPDSSSDDEDAPLSKPSGANKQVAGTGSQVGGAAGQSKLSGPKVGDKPKSLAEMAREMKANRGGAKAVAPNQPKQQAQEPVVPAGLGNILKTKEGKLCPASLTYRFRLPTIFFPLPLSSDQDSTEQPTKLVINISFEMDVPSTLSIAKLYESLQSLLAAPITSYISQRMGAAPVSGQMVGAAGLINGAAKTTNNQSPTNSNTTNLDSFPFTVSLAAPPSTIFTSQFVNKDKKRFPLGVETSMRNLNIVHRSAFFLNFRHIHSAPTSPSSSQSADSKGPIDLVQFITEQTSTTDLTPEVLGNKDKIKSLLQSIISGEIDQFIVS